MPVYSRNKKAGFNYEILDKYEAGLVLRGWQVKSIKEGNSSINEAYCKFMRGEIFLTKVYIKPWKGIDEGEAKIRNEQIKLLLNKAEISRIIGKLEQKGLSLLPMRLYSTRGNIKLEIALARGLKKHDKRARIKERDQIREINRDLKNSKYF